MDSRGKSYVYYLQNNIHDFQHSTAIVLAIISSVNTEYAPYSRQTGTHANINNWLSRILFTFRNCKMYCVQWTRFRKSKHKSNKTNTTFDVLQITGMYKYKYKYKYKRTTATLHYTSTHQIQLFY